MGQVNTAPARPGSAEPLVSLRDVHYRLPGATADTLDIGALDVQPGERLFIRGPSGCGKSTLLALMAGVLLADRGAVKLMQRDWRSLGAAHRDRLRAEHIGYIFQQFNLLPYLSVLDNVLLPCRFSARRADRAGHGATARRAAAGALLAAVGLGEPLWARPATALSVGQQQRVAAARALIGRPELVIADEPTSSLDESARESFMALLLQACAAAGAAVVFVSHDARLADRFDRHLDLPVLNRAVAPEATP
jgi:putative ABC transport system ATP-binding protein